MLWLSLVAAEPARGADSCGQVRFAGATALSTGNFPAFSRGLTTADFNGDGWVDLAVANYLTNVVSVFLAHGPGAYATAIHYEVGPSVSETALGDFNGDGVPDLAAVSAGNFSVLPGRSDGTFGAPIHTASAAARGLATLAVGDFNRDGKLDAAHKGEGFRMLLGNGDGTFTVGLNLDPSAPGGHHAEAADLNGDGLLDVVTANFGARVIRAFLGNGDGTFQTPISVPASGNPIEAVLGDFNHDDQLDLVSVNNSLASVSVFLGNGQGGFAIATNFATGTAPYSAALADFDRDGHLDIAVANQSGNAVSLILGAGDGSFREIIQHDLTNPGVIRAADFDGDGRPDLLAGTTTVARGNGVYLLRNLGNGRFSANPPSELSDSGARSVAAADFNGDGRLDLAAIKSGSSLIDLWLNGGEGAFQAGATITLSGNPMFLSAADFSGDGPVDLAAVVGASLVLARGNGDGTFQTPAPALPGGGFFLSSASSAAASDVNGDGRADLLVGGTTLSGVGLTVFLNRGDGTFESPVTYPGAGLGDQVVVGDFDEDGRPDAVVARQATNGFALYRGNGNGTFEAPAFFTMGTNVYSAAAADFNRDGHLDVATANFGCYSCGQGAPEGHISVRLGLGDGTFNDPVHYPATPRPQVLLTGDFTGDAIPDLAVADPTMARVTFMTGKGDGTFQEPVLQVLPSATERMALGDFNGDGKLDLVAPFLGRPAVGMLFNACESASPNVILAFTPRSGALVLSWPALQGFELQATTDLSAAEWDDDRPDPIQLEGRMEVTVPYDAPQRFFRLSKP